MVGLITKQQRDLVSRASFVELLIPKNEPGSSIMPGKVNRMQAADQPEWLARAAGEEVCASAPAAQPPGTGSPREPVQ